MKNYIANKVEDILDTIGLHTLAEKWYKSRGRWYRLKYEY